MEFNFTDKTEKLQGNNFTKNSNTEQDNLVQQIARDGCTEQLNLLIAERQWLRRELAASQSNPEKIDTEYQESELRIGNHLPALAILNSQGKSVYHNPTFVELFGYGVEEINQRGGLENLFDKAGIFADLARPQTWQGELNINLRKKQTKTFLVQIAGLLDKNSCFLGSLLTIIDLSATEKIEKKIQKAQKQLNKSLTEVQKVQEQLTILNKILESLYGSSSQEEIYHLLSYYIPRIFKDFSGNLILKSDEKQTQSIVSWCNIVAQQDLSDLQAPDPNRHLLRAKIEPINSFCTSVIGGGQEIGLLYIKAVKKQVFNNQQRKLVITISKHIGAALFNIQEKEQLRQECIKDPLTSLYNRRHLEEMLKQEMIDSIKIGQSLAILLIDIDHFKKINDDFGHNIGDLVIQTLGKFLKNNIQHKGYAYRYGGEEFLLVYPEMSAEMAQEKAEEIRGGVKRLVFCPEIINRAITISIGIATFPNHAISGIALINRADQALYRAKQLGRDRVEIAYVS